MVFSRTTSDNLTSLVKKLDKTKVNSFVVFLSDDEELEGKLKALAEKEGIKKTILSIDNVAGPKAYNVAKDAEVTVVLYNNRKVEANHAFKKGELNAKGIEAVLADIPKIESSK